MSDIPAQDRSVHIVHRHLLQCSSPVSLSSIASPFRLGPLDSLGEPIIPIAIVYVYRTPLAMTGSQLIPINRLKRALSILLDNYPYLTGRLHINDNTGRRVIDRLGTGTELLEAECAAPLSAFSLEDDQGRITGTQLPDGGNALLPPGLSVEGVFRDPFFLIQHTRFCCGSVAIGVWISHSISDASGLLQLVRHLAEIYRALSTQDLSKFGSPAPISLVHPPNIRSYLADVSEWSQEDRREALRFEPSLYYLTEEPAVRADKPIIPTDGAPIQQTTSPTPLSPVVGRVLRFSGQQLDAIKARAADVGGGGWVSTFDALAAYLCQRIYRARIQLAGASSSPSTPELVTDFLTSTNICGQLGLPAGYPFNALFAPSFVPPHEVLASGPLHEAAKLIHELTQSIASTPEQTRKTVSWIAVQPDLRRVKTPFRFGPGGFMVSQWNKFGMYDGVDFDVVAVEGEDDTTEAIQRPLQPALVWPPFTPIWLMCDGLAYFLSTEESKTTGTPAIDVNLSLSEPLWAIFDQDKQ